MNDTKTTFDRESFSSETITTFLVVVVLVLMVGVVGYSRWEAGPTHVEWEEGEVLDIVLACPNSYKIATMALLNSLHANSYSQFIRVWMFEEEGDEEEIIDALNSPENRFPTENIRILKYNNEKDLERLLPQVEQKYLQEQLEKQTPGMYLHRNPEEELRVHKLFTDQHNYIRYYIPSILASLFEDNNDNDNNNNNENNENNNENNQNNQNNNNLNLNNLFSTPPKQFIYLDCDMIVLKDPMILMRQVGPRLGAEKGVCMAAAARKDPTLLDSLAGEESEKTLRELGIPDDMTLSFNAGMLVVDIDCWVRRKALENLLKWLEIRTEKQVYRQGSQPPLLLSFVPEHTNLIQTEESRLYPPLLKYAIAGEEWDTQARNCVDQASSDVGIVHYTGKNKPWQMIINNTYQQNMWEQYAPLSLLPSDRRVVPPEETWEEKAERRERLIKLEIERYGKVLTLKEKEEARQQRLLEKVERERQRELLRLEKQRLRMEREEEKKIMKQRQAIEKEKKLAEKMALRAKQQQEKMLEKQEKANEKAQQKAIEEMKKNIRTMSAKELEIMEKRQERQAALWDKMRGVKSQKEEGEGELDEKEIEKLEKQERRERAIKRREKKMKVPGESWSKEYEKVVGFKLAAVVRMDEVGK